MNELIPKSVCASMDYTYRQITTDQIVLTLVCMYTYKYNIFDKFR